MDVVSNFLFCLLSSASVLLVLVGGQDNMINKLKSLLINWNITDACFFEQTAILCEKEYFCNLYYLQKIGKTNLVK